MALRMRRETLGFERPYTDRSYRGTPCDSGVEFGRTPRSEVGPNYASAIDGGADCGGMRLGVQYISESRMLLARFRGLGMEAAWKCLATIHEEVGRRPVEGVLFDVRDSDLALAATDARAFAAYLNHFLGRRRFAFVTASPNQYAIARMIAADARAGRMAVMVFENEQQAESWLCSSDPN
jgi:hypothetical protein